MRQVRYVIDHVLLLMIIATNLGEGWSGNS